MAIVNTQATSTVFPCNLPSWLWMGAACADTSIAVVGSPTGGDLTNPPANGDTAQALVDSLITQQGLDQQAVNALQVSSSPLDNLLGTTSNALPTVNLVLIGVGILGLMYLGNADPRRFGG